MNERNISLGKENQTFQNPGKKKKKPKESTDLSWLVGNGMSPSPFMDSDSRLQKGTKFYMSIGINTLTSQKNLPMERKCKCEAL